MAQQLLLSQQLAACRTGQPKAVRRVAASAQAAASAERDLWYPGTTPPKHLDGSMPGDYGFDPLSLSADEQARKWFQQAELVHSRVCMTSAAGIVIPGLLTKAGILNVPEWYDAGKVWADNNPQVPYSALLIVELALCGFVEFKRWMDFVNPGSQGDGSFFGITDGLKGQSNGYPGGAFDPLGYSRGDEARLNEYKTKEIKNGRLAILANLGFAFQYAATGKGPITNLFDHIADPVNNTFATNGVSIPFVMPLGT